MTDVLDLVARLPKEPEPEPEVIAEMRELHDPTRPTRHWLRGARRGSGPWKARHLTWQVHLAMIHHQPHMLASDFAVLDAIMRMMNDGGTDRLTVAQWEIAKACALPRQTVWDAMNRLMEDGWLRRITEGTQGKPRDGGTGTGRAAIYRLAVPQSQPPSRRQVVRESELGGRAKPSRESESSPAIKVLTNHRVLQIPVSDRATEDDVSLADSGPDQTDVSLAKPLAKDWLRDRLAGGPEMASVVIAEGIQAGYTDRTIYRAAKALGVASTYLHGFGDGNRKPPPHVTQWELP